MYMHAVMHAHTNTYQQFLLGAVSDLQLLLSCSQRQGHQNQFCFVFIDLVLTLFSSLTIVCRRVRQRVAGHGEDGCGQHAATHTTTGRKGGSSEIVIGTKADVRSTLQQMQLLEEKSRSLQVNAKGLIPYMWRKSRVGVARQG